MTSSLTESEARTKWCPFSRVGIYGGSALAAVIRRFLEEIAGAYGDVDQGIVDDVDEICGALNALDKEFERAVEEGRGAL